MNNKKLLNGVYMNKKIGLILITIISVLLMSCGNKTEEQNAHEEYPERTHSDEVSELILTSHQLEHIDLKTETAEAKEVDIPLVLSGRIALNEAFTAHISSRVKGRIEKVHVVISDRVQKDQLLLELYSLDFLAMQSEFIQAEERLKRIDENNAEHGTAKSIYESAKKKLEIIGLSEDKIQQLADNHTPLTLLPVRAPFSGTLLTGEARLGEYVDVGQDFFQLANLQNLWVLADVFEKDLSLINRGYQGRSNPRFLPK